MAAASRSEGVVGSGCCLGLGPGAGAADRLEAVGCPEGGVVVEACLEGVAGSGPERVRLSDRIFVLLVKVEWLI